MHRIDNVNRPAFVPRIPTVVVSLQDLPPIEEIEAAYQTGLLDMVELRMDLQPSWESAHRFAEALRLRGIPTLATIRSKAEGGGWHGSEAERLTSFCALIPHVSAVDIEISSEEIRQEVMEAARGAGKEVILSYHHFQETPPSDVLDRIAMQAQSLGADILKVAVWAEGYEDIRRLARFTLAHADQNLVTIAMGPHGLLSRIFFPVLGSLLTYASWGAPTAPGQMNAAETAACLARFYPDFQRPNTG
jgi:3-dehydroquinate dehydratase-1